MKSQAPSPAHRHLLAGLLLGPCATLGWAQTATWTGSVSKFWGGTANWSPSGIPASGADLLFDDSATLFTVDLGASDRIAGSITIDSVTAYSFADQNPGQTLTPGDVTVLSGTGHVFAVPIVLAADAAYDLASGTDLTISGIVSGSGGLTKTGDGTLALSGANTFTGDVSIEAGAIELVGTGTGSTVYALQNNTVTVNVDGGLQFSNGDTFYLGGLTGSADLDFGQFVVHVGANGASTTYSGTLTARDASEFYKAGSGTLTLTGQGIDLSYVYLEDGDLVFDGASGTLYSLDASQNSASRVVLRDGADLTLTSMLLYGELQVSGAGTSLALYDPQFNWGTTLIEDGARVTVSEFTFSNGNSITVDQATLSIALVLTSSSDTSPSRYIYLADGADGPALTMEVASGTATLRNTLADYGAGTGSVLKTGSGTLVLTGATNTYSGGTTISAGTLQIGDGGTTGWIAGDVANSGTLAFNRSDTVTFAGEISGSGSLTQAGSGTLILTADHPYTGGTTVSAGTLQIGDGGAIGSITGDVANSGTLVFNRSDDLVFAGLVSGSGGLSNTGAGTLTLAAANTFTGTAATTGGRIILGDALALQGATVALATSGDIDLNGHAAVTFGGLSGSVAFALGTTSLTVGGNGASTSYTGVLSGSGGLVKTGSGTLSLSGINTFTGDVSIDGGVINLLGDGTYLDADYSLQNNTVTINVDGGLRLSDAYAIHLGGLAGTGDLALGSADVYVGANGASTTYAGAFSSNSATLTKEGAGTLTLTGAGLYLSNFDVNAGAVLFDAATGSIGHLDCGDTARATFQNGANFNVSSLILGELLVTGEGTTLVVTTVSNDVLGTTLIEDGADVTISDFGFTTGVSLTVDQATLTISGLDSTGSDTKPAYPIYLADGAGGAALTIDVSSGTAKFRSTVGDYGSGSGSITKTGAGTLIISAATNTYTGGTIISAGTLQIGDGGTTGSIAGDVANAGALVFNRSDALTFSGVVSGSGSLTKQGAGALTLSGANTFTGATAINAGSIILGNALALQNSTVSINVDAGLNPNGLDATLGGLAGSGDLALGTGTLTVGGNGASTSYTGVLSGSGGLVKTGSGTLSLSAVNTFTGGVTIGAGVINLLGDGTGLDADYSLQNNTVTINVDGGLRLSDAYIIYLGGLAGSGRLALGDADVYVGANGASTTYAGAFSALNATLYKEGSGTLTLTASGQDLVYFDIDGGAVVFDGGNGSIYDMHWDGTRRVTFQNGADFSISSGEAGGEFLVTGEGTTLVMASVVQENLGTTLIEDGAQVTISDFGFTYGGSLSVNQATLSISGLSSTGSDTDSTHSIYLADGADGSALTIDVSSGTAKFRSTVGDYGSGSGSITKTGAGTLVLSGTLTYSGSTIVSAGAIQPGSASTLQNTTVVLEVDDGLDVNGLDLTLGGLSGAGSLDFGATTLTVGANGESTTYAGALTGTGALVKVGAGTLTLANTGNTHSGSTTISGGVLSAADEGALGAGGLTLDGGTLALTGSSTLTLALSVGAGGGTFDTPGLARITGGLDLGGNTLALPGGLYLAAETSLAAHGTLSGRISGAADSTIAASGGDLALGDSTSYLGFNHAGTLDAGANTVTLRSRGYAGLGILTTLSGGTIVAANGVALGVGDNLQGSGSVNAKVAAGPGSTIEATGDLTLGDASSAAGFASDGELLVGAHTVTIRDANQAGLGAYASLDGGTLAAANGLVLEFDEGLAGAGTVSVGDSAATSFINNGYVEGTGAGLVFDGYVKGVGTFAGTVAFGGTLAPGLSPGTMSFENLTLADTATLEIELGGWTRGTEYDLIAVSGALQAGGSISFTLVNGFDPAQLGTFDVIDWGALSGGFSSISLPTLSGGLSWDTSQLLVDGSVSITAIPEPAAYAALCALGSIGGAAFSRRRRRDGLR